MKTIHSLLFLFWTLFMISCQSNEEVLNNIGYLRLSVGANSSANTKTVPEGYKPKQIAVQIVNAQGKVVEETDDSETWADKSIALETGTYTVKASSNGFDGQESGFDIPYYAGSKEITIKSNQEVQEKIVCTLANVKVTVKFDAAFLEKFADRDISVQVGDQTGTNKFIPLNFSTAETRSAYFPVGNLYATLSVSNPDKPLEPYTLKKEFTEVKAKDHYILNYKLQETGETNITVTVDPTMHEYSYTFTVSTEAINNASLTAGAWDRLAYLKAENVTTASGVSLDGITFQYRVKNDTQTKVDETPWNDVATTAKESTYTAMLTGLKASTTYEYRLANANGETIGNLSEFTTSEEDSKETLYNGNFDQWNQVDKTWYPNEAGQSFWDSSNPGTTQGAASIVNKNPTTGVSSPVNTEGGQAACLKSEFISVNLVFTKIEKFAAASLYVGKFNSLVGTSGAIIDFGQTFTSKPISLKGYFQYVPVAIDHVGDGQPANTVSKGNMDVCSIFIILSKGTYQVNNTDVTTLLTEEKVKNNNQFIAYGELPASECVSTNGQWKEFNIPLKYKEQFFGEKPTHLIIVCTSSKYGDYFTGGAGSTLYLDDFELDYDGEPTIWK